MKLKIRSKEGRLALPWAIAAGFSISFLVSLALTFSASLTGQLIGGGEVGTQSQEEQLATTLTMLTSFWWWIIVSTIGIIIASYITKNMTMN